MNGKMMKIKDCFKSLINVDTLYIKCHKVFYSKILWIKREYFYRTIKYKNVIPNKEEDSSSINVPFLTVRYCKVPSKNILDSTMKLFVYEFNQSLFHKTSRRPISIFHT